MFGRNIVPELRLEGKRAVLVKEDILGEAYPVLAETVVEGIIAECHEPGLNLVKERVLVTLVLLVKEGATGVDKAVRLVVALRGEDKAGLEEGLADVGVELVEPPVEAFVVLDVVEEALSGVDDAVEGFAVGEMLQESVKLGGDVLEGGVVGELGAVLLADFSDGAGVMEVFLKHAREPGQAGLVVRVLLAFDNNLCKSELVYDARKQ